MATTLGKPRDKADRPESHCPIRVAAKCGVCIVALLGFVVLATTFVARLASIRILPATQFAEDLSRGSSHSMLNWNWSKLAVCSMRRMARTWLTVLFW